MKKITLFLVCILSLSIIAIILSSCTQPPVTILSTVTPSLTSPPQQVTITSTQTVTLTATQAQVPGSPSTTNPNSISTPVVSQFVDKNNPHFLVGRGISGYNKITNIDGTITQSPLYEDTFLDLDLLGFYTQRDAIFVPKIPAITTMDEWILDFFIPDVNLPAIINWGYITKSGKPDATFSFTIWRIDNFKTLYNTNPDTLINNKGIAIDLYTSADGTHVQNINQAYQYIAFVQTQNSGDILGWWMKSGRSFSK